jgi:hypothetical protein
MKHKPIVLWCVLVLSLLFLSLSLSCVILPCVTVSCVAVPFVCLCCVVLSCLCQKVSWGKSKIQCPVSLFISWIWTLSVFVSEHIYFISCVWASAFAFQRMHPCHRFYSHFFTFFLSVWTCISDSTCLVPVCVCSVPVYNFVCVLYAFTAA